MENPYGFGKDLLVSDIIDWNEGIWCEDAIKEISIPADAEIILEMRLSDHGGEDELVWQFLRDDMFTVRSAYNMWMDFLYSSKQAGTSNPSSMQGLWKKVWHSPVQPRIRSFLWRLCRRILPCRVNLMFRRVIDYNSCDACGAVEDEMHVLFHCLVARQIWKKLPQFNGLLYSAPDVLSLFDRVQSKFPAKDIQLWLYTLETNWNVRTKESLRECIWTRVR